MAFKMKGFNPGQGTSMGSAFQKKMDRLQTKIMKKETRGKASEASPKNPSQILNLQAKAAAKAKDAARKVERDKEQLEYRRTNIARDKFKDQVKKDSRHYERSPMTATTASSKKEMRQEKRAARKEKRKALREETGKTGVGRAIEKIGSTKIGKKGKHTVGSVAKGVAKGVGKLVVDPQSTDVGRAVSGISEAVSKIKKGKLKKGIKEGIKTYMDIKSRAKERKKAKKDEKKLASASEKPVNTSPVNEG